MEIKYKSKKVEGQCTNLKIARKEFQEFGKDVLGKINIIKSASNFYDVMKYSPFNCDALKGNLKNYWALDVKGRKSPWRFIVAPIDENDDIINLSEEFCAQAKTLEVILIEEVSKHYEH